MQESVLTPEQVRLIENIRAEKKKDLPNWDSIRKWARTLTRLDDFPERLAADESDRSQCCRREYEDDVMGSGSGVGVRNGWQAKDPHIG
jgi:hypothetical protein